MSQPFPTAVDPIYWPNRTPWPTPEELAAIEIDSVVELEEERTDEVD